MWNNDDNLKKEHGILLCGVDESGRGAYAGPMVAGAVCFGPDAFIEGVKDSKRLSLTRRANLYEYITAFSLAWGVGIVTPEEMDAKGMTWANRYVMIQACEAVSRELESVYGMGIDLYVIDNAPRLPELLPQLMVPRADDTYYCVAAASIIAKHTRDTMMTDLAEQYPNYGFENNKGYLSEEHIEAAIKYGTIPGVHRLSYRVKGISK